MELNLKVYYSLDVFSLNLGCFGFIEGHDSVAWYFTSLGEFSTCLFSNPAPAPFSLCLPSVNFIYMYVKPFDTSYVFLVLFHLSLLFFFLFVLEFGYFLTTLSVSSLTQSPALSNLSIMQYVINFRYYIFIKYSLDFNNKSQFSSKVTLCLAYLIFIFFNNSGEVLRSLFAHFNIWGSRGSSCFS